MREFSRSEREGGAGTPAPLPRNLSRAIAYLRVSTAIQEAEGMGLAIQRERVTEHARREGFELLDVVQETASGGVRDSEVFSWEHRPVLRELVERAKAGEYDVLIVARLDRLSRDYATLTVLERMLQRHGVEVVSTAEQNGDGPIAAYLRGNLALIAELERAMIRERLSAGKAQKRKEGRNIGGPPPYGYRLDDEGRFVVDADAAEVVRLIFEEARHGDGPARIVRTLTERGIPSPKGGAWNRKVVRGIVLNPAYAGERYGVKRAHPAIVSRQMWNRVNDALRARMRSQPSGCRARTSRSSRTAL